jgi:hypothetical protein
MQILLPCPSGASSPEKHGQEPLRISIYLFFCEHTERRDFLTLDWASSKQSSRTGCRNLRARYADYFQPHYRVLFASMSGLKDRLFLEISTD